MKIIAFALLLSSVFLHAQSYPPPAGQAGSTAIAADSDLFVSWATGIEVTRGYVDIANPYFEHNGSNFASFGTPEDALGAPTVSAVSLGDGGEATLTFNTPIADGSGFDFAVFENSFDDTFLELAFVEVSSDGTNFFRFPAHSETQTEEQVEGFGTLDARFLNNLAGKYRALFGTPFDISELPNDPLLNKNAITHVKIIDVVGNIDPVYARYDSFGNRINDPYSTPFFTGGFDLDAVGVIHEQNLGVKEQDAFIVQLYPNPATTQIYIELHDVASVQIYDVQGRSVLSIVINKNEVVDISALKSGMYVLEAGYNGKKSRRRFIKR